MSEPTTYDLVQDTRIKGVEDLVQTTYTPFQGPEFSYPVVHQPMDDEMWQQVTLGVGSGLLDVGGRPYWLRDLSDVTDTGKLTVDTTTGTAQAILRGFYHRLNQDLTLSFPPVSQKTVYQVVLEYDPLRHKEPGGPIRVRVLTSLDWSGGKHYLPLWDVERNPSQLLSDAKVTQKRPKISPTIHVDYPESMPDPRTQLWGATCYIRYGDEAGATYVADGGSEETGGPTRWRELTTVTTIGKPSTDTYLWEDGRLERDGKKRRAYGRVRRAGGSDFTPTSNGFQVWFLSEKDRPASSVGGLFGVAVGGGSTNPVFAKVTMRSSENTIVLYPQGNSAFFDLNGFEWTVD